MCLRSRLAKLFRSSLHIEINLRRYELSWPRSKRLRIRRLGLELRDDDFPSLLKPSPGVTDVIMS